MPVEHGLISKAIEGAQKKVEGNNFDMRKHLVEYDDVINKHREAIYRRRREILELAEGEGEHGDKTLSDIILEYVRNEVEKIVEFNCVGDIKDWNLKEVVETVANIFNLNDAEKAQVENIGKSEVHDPGHEIVIYLNAVCSCSRISRYYAVSPANYLDSVRHCPAAEMT